MTLLHSPYSRAGQAFRNRIAMAPMTRSRALGNVPNALMAEYYRQRASAGLVVTEGVAPAPEGLGYARIPGLFTEAQRDGWRPIAEAVHAGGGKLFIQLMHTARIGHPLNLPEGATMIAPSAVAAAGTIWTDLLGQQPHPVPKAMDDADIARVRAAFVQSARYAREAGADGVELHAANGYLFAQFLNPRSNVRTDAWGGNGENRRRFLLAVLDDTIAAIGREHVGVRLSPFNPYNDLEAGFAGEREEFLGTVDALAARGIAYLHLAGGSVKDELLAEVRRRFPGTLVVNGGFDAASAENVLAAGHADVVAFGVPFIANPDLPARLRDGLPLAKPDPATFFSADARGYTDWPAYEDAVAA
jgi:N-ethylmaleimide reductase